jgi:L-methionine (R)-S-oxide reductase
LANASSLIFNSLVAFPACFGNDGASTVNWCGACSATAGLFLSVAMSYSYYWWVLSTGFYLDSHLFPYPRGATPPDSESNRLLLGPFCGKPACQFINTAPGRGVCADAYLQRKTVLVEDVEKYPGHIACDGDTRSEIVCPLIRDDGSGEAVGVLDLDCLVLGGFDANDQAGLERICKLIVSACDW